MTRRLSCESCLRSDVVTAFSIQLGKRVCVGCQALGLERANRPAPLTAADDPWPTGVDTQPFGDAS